MSSVLNQLLAEEAARSAAYARRRQDREVSLTPEEEQTLLAWAGNKSLGGLAYVGETLDKPGRAVRGLLAGRPSELLNLIPFSDAMELTNPGQSTSGRDLLEHYGVLRKNREGLDSGDVAGLLAEIAVDPMTYVGGLGAAGKFAKAAGLTDDLARTASGILGKKVGRRVAAATFTPRSLAAAQKTSQQAMDDIAKGLGYDLNDILDKPIGGLLELNLPFSSKHGIHGTFGTGPTAKKILGGMDWLEDKALRGNIPGTGFSPGRMLSAGFNSAVGGLMGGISGEQIDDLRRTFAAQGMAPDKIEEAVSYMSNIAPETAKAAHRAKTLGRYEAMSDVQDTAEKLKQAGWGGDALRKERRMGFEGVLPAASIPAKVAKVFNDTKAGLEALRQNAIDYGMDMSFWGDTFAEYFPRYLSKVAKKGGKGGGNSLRVLSTFDSSQIHRKPWLSDIPQGATQIDEIVTDPVLNNIIDHGGDAKLLRAAVEQRFKGKIQDEYFVRDGSGAIVVDPTTGKQVSKNRWDEMAEWLPTLSKDVRKVGVFANDPLLDLQARRLSAVDSIKSAEAVLNTVAEMKQKGFLKAPTSAVSDPNWVSVNDTLNAVGIKGEGRIQKLADLTGLKVDEAKKLLDHKMPKDVASQLTRYIDTVRHPESMNKFLEGVDSMTNLFRVGVTGIWPAFHVRNFVSGQFQNFLEGNWSMGSMADSWKMMRGGVIEDANKIPYIVRRYGPNLSPEQATDALRREAASNDLASRYGGQVTGQAQGSSANTYGAEWSDMMATRPGDTPFDLKDVFDKATYRHPDVNANPLDVRGQAIGLEPRTTGKDLPIIGQSRPTIGVDRPQSGFFLARAGEDIGYLTEGMNRLSPWLERMRRGESALDAAEAVKKTQVDYHARGFSKFERDYAQRAIPFYKFLSRSLPHHLEQLIKNPGGRQAQTIRAIKGMHSDQEVIPDYVAETAAIRIPEGTPLIGAGPGSDPRFLTGLGLMFEQPMKIMGGGGMRELGAMLNPMLKMPAEMATGASLFQAGPEGPRQLEDMDPLLGRIAANLTGKEDAYRGLPIAAENLAANGPWSRALTFARTATDTRKTIPVKALNLGTGLRFSDVSERAQDAIAREALQDVLRGSGAKTFKKVYVPKDVEAKMDPDTLEKVRKTEALLAVLASRAKKRAEAKKKAEAK